MSCRARCSPAPGQVQAQATDCINLIGDGSLASPLEALPILSPDPDNTLSCGPAGLLAGEPAYEEFIADSQLTRQFYMTSTPYQGFVPHITSLIPIAFDQTYTGTSWQAPQAPWLTVDAVNNQWTFTKTGTYILRFVTPYIRIPVSFVSDRIGGEVSWSITNILGGGPVGTRVGRANSRFTVEAGAGGNNNARVMSDLIFTVVVVPAGTYVPYYGWIMGGVVGGIEVGSPMGLTMTLFNWDRIFSQPATWLLNGGVASIVKVA